VDWQTCPKRQSINKDGIDVVIAWVDGRDRNHRAKRRRYLADPGGDARPEQRATDDRRSQALIDELDRLREEHQWFYRLAHEQAADDAAPTPIAPAQAQAVLAGAPDGDSIGLGNVDARMRDLVSTLPVSGTVLLHMSMSRVSGLLRGRSRGNVCDI